MAGKGVFKLWDDYKEFERAHIGEHGEITWNNEIDLCPMPSMMRLTGKRTEVDDMDRRIFLDHLRKTRFSPVDRDQALAEARAIAEYLKSEYGARVVGIGSLFSPSRVFRQASDIDLVVEGLPAAEFFRASARAAGMTQRRLDIIPLESASSLLHERVREEGVEL